MPSSNPVPPDTTGGLPLKQSIAFNALLTRLTTVVNRLQTNIAANRKLDKKSNAVICWQYVLHDLKTVVLPEFYVVFHDETTVAPQRRRLYDMTQAIYFALLNYDKPIFLQKIALCDLAGNAVMHYQVTDDSAAVVASNGYMTGQGPQAQTAHALREMAHYINVDSAHYINEFAPYLNLLLNEQSLLKCFEKNALPDIKQTLQHWHQQRLTAFSLLNEDSPIPSHLDAEHPLADWILDKPSPDTSNSSRSSHALTAVKPSSSDIIAKPDSLKHGLKYGAISLVLFAMASSFSIGFVLFGLFYLITTIISAYSLSDALNYERYLPQIKQYNGVAAAIAFVALFFGGLYTGAAITVLATSFFVQMLIRSPHIQAKRLPPAAQQTPPLPNQTPQRTKRATKPPQDFATIKKTAVDIKPQPPSKNYDLPLDINRHGYHLAILLSDKPTEHLKQLIVSANKLYEHLDYLTRAHPYLATRVDELVKDLAQNTIVRLDELASQFVHNGQVNPEAKAVFKQQHEKRVDNLIVLNLEQVNGLNKTILEKQMAGFAHIGNAIEQKFRDKVMELKILLRWLIAQQPDEVQASNHEVILENLETSTLADMQAAFFASTTTTPQREALQAQIEALIEHFKAQTPQSIQQYSNEQEDNELQELLQLSKSTPSSHDKHTDSIDLDSVNTQAETQDFIDYNNQYIIQLLKYWH